MLHLNEEKKLNLIIDSAGTANYHFNEAPDRRTIKSAKKHGIDLSPLRARQFESSDLDAFDYIFAMDKQNYKNILSHVKTAEQESKVHLLLDYTGNKLISEVPDPYYGTEKDFDLVYDIVNTACHHLCNQIK